VLGNPDLGRSARGSDGFGQERCSGGGGIRLRVGAVIPVSHPIIPVYR
jgi:hypothetical protein